MHVFSQLPVYKAFRRRHQISIYVAEIVERNTAAAEKKGQLAEIVERSTAAGKRAIIEMLNKSFKL